jgi:hypothetical protein
MKTIAHASSIVLVLVVLNGQAPARPETACERLASLSMPHATIGPLPFRPRRRRPVDRPGSAENFQACPRFAGSQPT